MTQEYESVEFQIVKKALNRISWAESHLRLLRRIRTQFEQIKPFAGLTKRCFFRYI